MGCQCKSNSLKRFFDKIFSRGRTRKRKQKRRGRKRQKGGEGKGQVNRLRKNKTQTKKVLLPSENKTRSSTKRGDPAFHRIKKGVKEGFDKAMSFITDKQQIMKTNLNDKFEDMKDVTSSAAKNVLKKGRDVVNNTTDKINTTTDNVLQKGEDVVNNAKHKINNTTDRVNSKLTDMKRRTLKNKRNALCNMAISLMNASQRAQFKNIDCGGRKTKKRSMGSLPGNRVLNREHRHSSTKR